jgi:hypothetical protein
MNQLSKILNELGFEFIPQEGCDAWSKIYNGFILFIVKAPNGKLLSSITIGCLEISLPNIPNVHWIIDFDKENSEN